MLIKKSVIGEQVALLSRPHKSVVEVMVTASVFATTLPPLAYRDVYNRHFLKDLKQDVRFIIVF